ncbi:transporter [Hoeflea sp. CAU 1731]|jgi:acetyl-CoA acetyltransferase|nr:thiolase family protein [Paracoccaceae bacterium]
MSSTLSTAAAITGIGEVGYSRSAPEQSELALELGAALLAISDAGLQPRDIDGLIPFGPAGACAEDIITNLGLGDLKFSAHTPLGGASAVAAIQCAALAIHAGLCRHVLVSLGRNGMERKIGARLNAFPQFKAVREFEQPSGMSAPAQLYAPMARRHMELFGTTSADFAEIALSTRLHAMRNPMALMTAPMIVEDHQASRVIADPLRLFDCSIESNGGAAFIVSTAQTAPDLAQHPVLVAGVAEGHPDEPLAISQRADLTTLGTARAAERAFAMAGIGPEDIDLAEIYDCFTYIVLCQIEDLGFCEKGEGGAFVQSGVLRPGGALPVNTHGGLLSQAHMAGYNHVTELVRQLRHAAGPAQVPGAQTGLVTGFGDMGDGAVAILRRG